MPNITFVGPEGDTFCLDEASSVIISQKGEIIKDYAIESEEELNAWKNKVVGWWIYELGNNFVTLTKDQHQSDLFQAIICLQCGHWSHTYFSLCPECGSIEEPVFASL